MKLRRTKRMPATAKQKLRAKRLAQLKRFLREHTWGVMITVLIMIALILFVCVIAGAAPKEASAPETTQDASYVMNIRTVFTSKDSSKFRSDTKLKSIRH